MHVLHISNISSLLQKEYGWSVAALQAGASDLGLSKAASGMVPNGAAGLVEVCGSPAAFSCHSMLSHKDPVVAAGVGCCMKT